MSDRIESRLKEDRRFIPSPSFSDRARVTSHAAYAAMYRKSLDEPEEFWREETQDLVWREKRTTFVPSGTISRRRSSSSARSST